MNRTFENRKPTKVYAKSKENQSIIKALNIYGRVPEQWELLNELDKYKNVIDKIDKLINTDYGWVSYYYKYNNRYLKSEIKEDINKLLEEVE